MNQTCFRTAWNTSATYGVVKEEVMLEEGNYFPDETSNETIPDMDTTNMIWNKRKRRSSEQLLDDLDTSQHVELKQTTAAEEDDVDVFFKSIALTVKKFPPHIRSQAKMETLSLISNFENLAFSFPLSSLSTNSSNSTSSEQQNASPTISNHSFQLIVDFLKSFIDKSDTK